MQAAASPRRGHEPQAELEGGSQSGIQRCGAGTERALFRRHFWGWPNRTGAAMLWRGDWRTGRAWEGAGTTGDWTADHRVEHEGRLQGTGNSETQVTPQMTVTVLGGDEDAQRTSKGRRGGATQPTETSLSWGMRKGAVKEPGDHWGKG